MKRKSRHDSELTGNSDLEWPIQSAEVDELCYKLVKEHGIELIPQQVLNIAKQLDKGESIFLGDIGEQSLRRRLRHLLKALSMAGCDIRRVPGAAPVVQSFKKPEDCPVNLARYLKPRMVQAVSSVIKEETEAVDENHSDDRFSSHEVEPGIAKLIADALTAMRTEPSSALIDPPSMEVEGKTREDEDDKDEGPQQRPKQSVPAGIMSLNDYKQYSQDSGDSVAGEFMGGDTSDSRLEGKSLLEMRKDGLFNQQEIARKVKQYKIVQERNTDLWGLSKRKQDMLINRGQKANENNSLESLEGDNNDEGEPWARFDREKLFAQITEKRHEASAQSAFNELLEMASERKLGGFKRRES